MFKYKQFIIGFLVGAILFSASPISAAIEEYICYKADYKVVVNGAEYTDPNLPILNYKGNTYVPFRSMLEKAGLKINWNAKYKQAEVTKLTDESESENVSETKITQTPDGITQIDTWEGKQYIGFLYVQLKIRDKGYDLQKTRDGKWQLIHGENILIEDVPTTLTYGYDSIELSYYINTILPLIK